MTTRVDDAGFSHLPITWFVSWWRNAMSISVTVSLFVLYLLLQIWLDKSIQNPITNLIMRRAGLSSLYHLAMQWTSVFRKCIFDQILWTLCRSADGAITLNNNNIDLIPMFRKCMFFSQVCWWCPAREDQCHCQSRVQGGIPFPFPYVVLIVVSIQECLLFWDRATSTSGVSREWGSRGWWRSSTSLIHRKPTSVNNETHRDVSSAALKKVLDTFKHLRNQQCSLQAGLPSILHRIICWNQVHWQMQTPSDQFTDIVCFDCDLGGVLHLPRLWGHFLVLLLLQLIKRFI